MDRQLLLGGLVTAIILAGCSRKESPQPEAQVQHKKEVPQYKKKTTYDFPVDEVSGDLLRPETLDELPDRFAKMEIPAPPKSAPPPPVDVEREVALARQKAAAEEARRMVEAEGQKSGGLNIFGGNSFAPQPPAGESNANPLRVGASPMPEPASANPLRESRIAPRMAAPPEPSFAPARPQALPQPLPGALPPMAAADPIAPRDTNAGGPAAPDSSETSAPRAAVSLANDLPYDVVEVFYGTDRKSAAALPGDWRSVLMQFVSTATFVLITLCVGLVASARRSWVLWLVAVGGIGVSLGLGYQASAKSLALVRSAGKQGPRYTTERAADGKVALGRCEITIPKTHQAGELEAPSVMRLEVVENATEHLLLHKTEPLLDARFYELLRQRVEESARRELFVFVHGFNVSFEDAARRTAQIHYDMRFDGAPVFYSWPANDKFIFTYPADETNIAWSVPHLKQFLLDIVKQSGAKSINLIAHSMGNRGLAAALREIDLEMRGESKLFNQVILAAPDIDADEFRMHIAPALERTAQRLTLYASSHDEALMASQFVHRGPRAGDAGDGLIVVQGIDTIDVTAIDSSLWGHSYYGSSNPVLHDLRTLLSKAIPPGDRTWLSPAQRDGLTYWIFQPARTAGMAGESPR
jgi:esterase/lipase superfamily enzyme